MTARIFDIQRFCLHDGPGIRTTVFFKGCPLHCVWCHNPESQQIQTQLMYFESKCVQCGLCVPNCQARDVQGGKFSLNRTVCTLCGQCVSVCPTQANKIIGIEMQTDEILQQVLRDKPFFGDNGGLTLSGGEPAMQPTVALDLIEKAEQCKIGTVLETSGFGQTAFFEQAAKHPILFYYDLKALCPEKHKALTGVDNEITLANLEYLFSVNSHIVLRLPLIQGVNDSDDDLRLLAEFLSKHKEHYEQAQIMKYHILGKTKAIAIGRVWTAPNQNAPLEQVDRWLTALNAKENKVILS
ncbi:MAG TPA: hypothetical protein DDY98_02895 [Ruminococcaceae bacterium]|nr:hypothetical protein [Oscillospiraceae bacterium]